MTTKKEEFQQWDEVTLPWVWIGEVVGIVDWIATILVNGKSFESHVSKLQHDGTSKNLDPNGEYIKGRRWNIETNLSAYIEDLKSQRVFKWFYWLGEVKFVENGILKLKDYDNCPCWMMLVFGNLNFYSDDGDFPLWENETGIICIKFDWDVNSRLTKENEDNKAFYYILEVCWAYAKQRCENNNYEMDSQIHSIWSDVRRIIKKKWKPSRLSPNCKKGEDMEFYNSIQVSKFIHPL